MPLYERAADSFINTKDSHFLMKDSARKWNERSEAFGTLFGYVVFARRLELCLRAALGVETQDREGLGSLFSDLTDVRNGFSNVRRKIKIELSESLRGSNIIDCGAGTGSMMGFIEWVDLPYPRQFVLVEPNPEYFNFMKKRIEDKDKENNATSLIALSKTIHDRHADSESIVYEVEDTRNGNLSEIQIINSTVDGSTAFPIAQEAVLTFVGVSKYYSASEFKEMIDVASRKLIETTPDRVAFNTQGTGDVIPSVSHFERSMYRTAKRFHQIAISGKPNLHNFYTREDLDSFGRQYNVAHNFGNAIVVSLT